MRINLNNYEEWMIDYLDGNLDQSSIKEVEAFLLKHPHIAEEIEDLHQAQLSPSKSSSLSSQHISGLMKQEIIAVDQINEETYEEFFIASYENDLSKKDLESLKQFLYLNKSLEDEYKAFGLIQIKADKSIQFENKSQLKREERKAIPLWLWSGAAAAILIIGFWIIGFEEEIRPDYFPREMESVVATTLIIEEVKTELPARRNLNSSIIISESEVEFTRSNDLPMMLSSIEIDKLIVPDQSWQKQMELMQSYALYRNNLTSQIDWASIPSEHNKSGFRLVTALLWKTTKSGVQNFGEDVFSDELQFLASENLETITDGVISVKRPAKEVE
jgi:hypothetical protein